MREHHVHVHQYVKETDSTAPYMMSIGITDRQKQPCCQSTAPAPSELLLLFKKVGDARLGATDLYPISPNTPAPRYQPIKKKIKKKIY